MRTLSVLICDDEPYVVELIKRLVDWSSFNMAVVATAYDGMMAYNLICSEKPDIVISDIRMSGMNGLDLVHSANQLPRATHFIIISGHKQFDYAYTAIKQGVEDYLLKPVKAKDLSEILIKIRKKIDTESQSTQLQTLHEQYKNSQSHMRQLFLKQYNEHTLPPVLTGQLVRKEYLYALSSANIQLGALAIDAISVDSELHTADIEIIEQRIEKCAKEALSVTCEELCVYASARKVLFLTNYNNPEPVEKALSALIETVRDQFRNQAIRVTMALSPVVSDPDQISICCDGLENALDERYILTDKQIIKGRAAPVKEDPRALLPYGQWLRLENIIELLDEKALESFFQDSWNAVFNSFWHSPSLFPAFVNYIFAISNLLFQKHHSEFTGDTAAGSSVELFNYSSAREIWRRIYMYICDVIRSVRERKEQLECQPVQKAKKYIMMHLDEDITLDTIGRIVFLNPAYFCTLFKRETGMAFQDFLLDCRISRAKALLKEAQLSIATVSESVGYKDSRYFSRVFRKKTGINPNEYRKLFCGG